DVPGTASTLSLKFRIDSHVTLPVFLSGENLNAVAFDQEVLESRLRADFAPTHLPFCIDFTDQGNSVLYTGRGWAPPEIWGRWTDGTHAEMKIRFTEKPRRPLHLAIAAHAMCLPGLPPVEARINANGETRCNASFPKGREKILKFKIPAAALQSGECKITFEIKNAQSPGLHGNSDDRRQLGMGIRRIDCRW
ncbi:MAG TPA: hypothetical protein VG733_12025, partial [Chthoniobacteraceae bacterium]|nr:hypothetical protein [Chthoniobacteraceae bacterium]